MERSDPAISHSADYAGRRPNTRRAAPSPGDRAARRVRIIPHYVTWPAEAPACGGMGV